MSNAASGLAHLKPFLPGLEPLLEDAEVSEIMINGPGNVWIEARGRLTAHAAPGLDESALLRAAIHIARPLGLDPASPHVAITIRRFGKRTFSAEDLVEQKALPENVLKAAERMLMTRRNILVSGGTGSGKTTLLNALIELLPVDERIVAIEDTLAAIIHKFGVSVDFLRKFRAESVFRCDYKASKLVEPNRDEARAPSGNSSARRGLYICVGAGSQGTVRWDTDGASVMRRAFVRDKTMPGAPRCDEKFPEPGHRF